MDWLGAFVSFSKYGSFINFFVKISTQIGWFDAANVYLSSVMVYSEGPTVCVHGFGVVWIMVEFRIQLVNKRLVWAL